MRVKTPPVLVLGLLLVTAATAADMTVDQVVAANLEAKGGEAAWKAVQSGRMTGSMRVGGSAAGALEMPFTVEFRKPDKIRLEFTMQGMTAVQAFDGRTGWAILPFMGKTEPEEMAADQLKQLKDQADFEGALVNYKGKGHTVELLGKQEVDGTPAYKLKVVKANGDVDTLYLDAEYFVEFKMESRREIQGAEVTVATVLGDYKEVGGLLFAHSIEMSFAGIEAQQVITIESVELGVDLPDERFAMPAKAAVEEPTTK